MIRYFRLWIFLARLSFIEIWSTRLNSLGWLLGKLVRLAFFFLFIVAIFRHTKTIKGYTLPEAALFFLTFNLVDLSAQILFRGIYGIRRIVVEGELDYYLLSPANALFRVAFQTVDFLDLITVVPVVALTAWAITFLPAEQLTPAALALYGVLILTGVTIAFAIHVIVAAVAVLTQQLENTIWFYRDMMILGRFPVDIYAAPIQWAITVIIPIAVMTSYPAKALLGVLTWRHFLLAVNLAALFLTGSLCLWRYSLRRYTSVSS
ncbi:MAG: ABC-2 family transporter protein [Elusimicrobia bacterium]|nr:ABC-2 family transporter protein [Elusimicrobiota bacterium]